MRDRHWQLDAACRGSDPNVFLPREAPDGTSVRPPVATALRYCQECPVQAECHAYAAEATDYPMVGVWGGRYIGPAAAENRRMSRKRANKEALP